MDATNFFKFKDGTKETVVGGALCVGEKILYYLFKSPYVLWRMSCSHLSTLRSEAKLDIDKIDKPLPFLSFLVRFILDFLFHALIFLSVILAPLTIIYSIIGGFIDIINGSFYFSFFLSQLVMTFAGFYYAPIAIRLVVELLLIIQKYGLIICKYLFLPIIIIYHFFSYLASKCKFKTVKYEKKIEEYNK